MCSLPNYALNSDVGDLQQRIQDSGVHGAVEYACRSWYKHLVVTKHQSLDLLLSALHVLLEEKFTFWLEVLSVLGAVGEAVPALTTTIQWLNQISSDSGSLLDTIKDCLRFVTEFFEVISQSAPHIYHSALQFTPQSSIVQKLYFQQTFSLKARVVTGVPVSWDSCTASIGESGKARPRIAWSPCSKYIAATREGKVEVWDSTTLERLSIIKGLRDMPVGLGLPTFSPNGQLLACITL
ncbi:hypothetical protein BJ322DRAFT_999553 [Thelephora terrestris]|uniref:Uncharacterized protein n=1 Tax=Thelephora terrestris TaxID=56493 RepID=A0A9P6HMT5_9AGAM|nr:hypothetical protein BJ322DRAFT_999553 [Thelephora terrestris]